MLARSAVYASQARKLVTFRCLRDGAAHVEVQKLDNSAIAKEAVIEFVFGRG